MNKIYLEEHCDMVSSRIAWIWLDKGVNIAMKLEERREDLAS